MQATPKETSVQTSNFRLCNTTKEESKFTKWTKNETNHTKMCNQTKTVQLFDMTLLQSIRDPHHPIAQYEPDF